MTSTAELIESDHKDLEGLLNCIDADSNELANAKEQRLKFLNRMQYLMNGRQAHNPDY